MSLFKKVVKKVVKPAYKKVVKPLVKKASKEFDVGGPSVRSVAKALRTYNPVTGPIKAIKKVTKTLQAPPKKGRR